MLSKLHESYDNQREFYRVDLSVACMFRLRTIGTKRLAPGEIFEGQVQNISGGGLAFLTSRDLPVSPLLAWQVLVDLEGEKLDLLGHLVWKSAGGDPYYRYGMKFIVVEESQTHKLMAKLNRLQMMRMQKERQFSAT